VSRSRFAGRRALAGAAAAVMLAAAGLALAGAASAADVIPADPAVGGTLFLANGNDGTDYPSGATIGWNDPVIALPAPGDQTNRLVAPPGTESVVTFVGPQGRESDPTSWNATAPWELTPPGQWLADVTPYHLISPGTGNPSGTNATAAVGGDYSLGLAYLQDGGRHVVPGGLYFVHIHLTGNAVPDQATYTWQPVQATGPAADPSSSPTSGAATTNPTGLLSFVAALGSGPSAPLGTLTVGDGGTSGSASSWTVTVSTGPGPSRGPGSGAGAEAEARTLATGSGGSTAVDTAPAIPATSGAATITLTVVSG